MDLTSNLNPTIIIILFVVITGIAIFLATRERDDVIDMDEKIPRGTAKKIDTGTKTIEIMSEKKHKELKKILKHKDIKGRGKR